MSTKKNMAAVIVVLFLVMISVGIKSVAVFAADIKIAKDHAAEMVSHAKEMVSH
ncbi:MAG: hypothetical protein HY349_04350, partial [Nitrospirae bacterium]|nr:hypothetical protein [Nitrospirota bacterium]